MSLFTPASNNQCHLKALFHGFGGSGKTYTASRIAIGLHKLLVSRKISEQCQPIYIIDTEHGSDLLVADFNDIGISLRAIKTRAFADVISALDELDDSGAILIIDSMTHIWREFVNSYLFSQGKTQLEAPDWIAIKSDDNWGAFNNRFINSNLHIILCGRAGYEYDNHIDDNGNQQISKSGIKTKAESELEFEPSLVVYMARSTDPKNGKLTRSAQVWKDRSTKIDGLEFSNPTFSDFLPHIEALNLGGTQKGVDVNRNSLNYFQLLPGNEQSAINSLVNKIRDLLLIHYPTNNASDKANRLDYLNDFFRTTSYDEIKEFSLTDIQSGYDHLKEEISPTFDHSENFGGDIGQ